MTEVPSNFDNIAGGPFEAAVRTKFGLGPDWHVTVEVSGGKEYQLGDYTWDTEPFEFEVRAQPMTWQGVGSGRRGDTWILMGDANRKAITKKFGSVPEIWEWLAVDEQKAIRSILKGGS